MYLDYVRRTENVFLEYPALEPLRYFIFKQLWVGRESSSAAQTTKRWVRPLLRRQVTALPTDSFDVLFWLDNLRTIYVDTLMPVRERLSRRGVRSCVIAGRVGGSVPTDAIQLRVAAQARTPSWARPAWLALRASLPGLDNHSARPFRNAVAEAEADHREFNRILRTVRPRIVVDASTGLPRSASLIVQARELGISSFVLQHGLEQAFYTPVVADKMVVWGRAAQSRLASLGVPTDKLTPLGSPRHDSMRPGAGDARAAFMSKIGREDRPTLVFFSNGNDFVRNENAPVECAKWLEIVATEFERQINIVVRLHPNETGDLYKNCSHLVITRNDISLETTLQGCDVAASLCSSVLVEALLFKKPALQFYKDGWPELADNWRRGLALRISSLDDLRRMATQLRNGDAVTFSPSACDDVFAHHGSAAEHVAEAIQQRIGVAAQ